MEYGLLGERLGHSWSPAIHAKLGDYRYELYERAPEELEGFLRSGAFRGLNVTIPYKKTVIPCCDELSPLARRIGSVNLLLRREDGSLYGDNADAFGFLAMMERSGIDAAGKKALVLGSGGASVMVQTVLADLGAESVIVISRSGEDNYGNLEKHADAQIIVNTTPVGMYPGNGASPVDLSSFPRCEGVLDLIYNPARTALMMQAEELGIPHLGGLVMLVAQAVRSAEAFMGKPIERERAEAVLSSLARDMENIVLVGMPGCGKSAVAALLGERLGRPVRDSDSLVEEKAGMPIPEIFARFGEDKFRELETAALAELGRESGIVLATGGGAVLREENYPLLRQNGAIFWLKREIKRLPTAGRPISQSTDLDELCRRREPRYARFACHAVDNNGALEDTADGIIRCLEGEL